MSKLDDIEKELKKCWYSEALACDTLKQVLKLVSYLKEKENEQKPTTSGDNSTGCCE